MSKVTRRFKSPYWDVPPVGFEHITPKQYKQMQSSGQVPQTIVNPSSEHLQGTRFAKGQPNPMEAARAAAAIIEATLAATGGNLIPGSRLAKGGANPVKAASQAPTRQARRLYVGNIPFGCSDQDMIDFFYTNMSSANPHMEPGNPVLACQINSEKNFAFLEFRSIDETTAAIALDGVLCKGQALKIRRPHDYQPIAGSEAQTIQTSSMLGLGANNSQVAGENYIPGVVSNVVADSPNKIYIGGLPTYLTEDPIKEILASFGTLKAFNLIRDPSTMASKGYAFCEYLDPSKTEGAILALNGFDISDKKLVVQRASVGAKSGPLAGALPTGPHPTPSISATGLLSTVQIQVPGLPAISASSTPRVLTEVLCLMNMVEPSELKDDEEYEEILEDIEEECSKYGSVRSIQIPRPRGEGEPVAGLGKVFVEFGSATEAQRAQLNLAGRRFANRVVVTSYFDRDRYRNKEF